MGDVLTKLTAPLDTCVREFNRRCLDECDSSCTTGCCQCSVVTHHTDIEEK